MNENIKVQGVNSIQWPQAIEFHGKIIRENTIKIYDGRKNAIIEPYFFLNEKDEKVFIGNMVGTLNNLEECRKARIDIAKSLLSLRKHHFMYYTGKGEYDDVEKFIDYVKEKGYTLSAMGGIFQYPLNRESTTFIGKVKETREEFIYRIYNRELFLYLLHRLKTVKRETVRLSNKGNKVP